MNAIPETVDVMVIGCGPAGSAVALELVGAGVSVAILERTRYDSLRVGETLPPDAQPLLRRLGVWETFQNDFHVESPGILVAWESEVPHENDFLFNPYGSGWHLDRVRFDRMLADRCVHAGAVVCRESRIRSCTRTADSQWIVAFECGGVPHEVAATFLIDATGRSAWLARSHGAKRIVRDQLLGVIGFGESADGEDRRTLIEATPEGWWYSARLPGRKIVASFMTDADMIPTGSDNLRQFWGERLRAAPLTSARWPNPSKAGELRVRFSGTVRLDRVAGPGWLAVGDAVLAYDPLSSEGILKAMESGARAAAAVLDSSRGGGHSAALYAEEVDARFAEYTRNYFHYYGLVRRWPNQLFWARRAVATVPPTSTPSPPESIQ